jgi:hypothetical protein
MDKELKEKWVTALRSGKYKQGRLFLRSIDNEFCCLGVLCDVYNNTDWKEYGGCYSYGSTTDGIYYIPHDIAFQIGIIINQQHRLSYKNEVSHQSFQEIADYIERNL